MWGNKAKMMTGALLAFSLMVTGPVAAFADQEPTDQNSNGSSDVESERGNSGRNNSDNGNPKKDETKSQGNGNGQGNNTGNNDDEETDTSDDVVQEFEQKLGGETAASSSSNHNANDDANTDAANKEKENSSDNAAQKDPTINLAGCETVGFTEGDSLLDALANCLGRETFIETFRGRSLLRLAADEANLLSPVATNPPELVGNRPASVWSAVNGTANTFEVEGSADNLERALGEVLLRDPTGDCSAVTIAIFGLNHVPASGAPIMQSASAATVEVCAQALGVTGLATQLLSSQSFVPRDADRNELLPYSAARAYAFRFNSDVCKGKNGENAKWGEIQFLSVGTCTFEVTTNGVALRAFKFEIVESFLDRVYSNGGSEGDSSDLVPSELEPVAEVESQASVPQATMDQIWADEMEGDETHDNFKLQTPVVKEVEDETVFIRAHVKAVHTENSDRSITFGQVNVGLKNPEDQETLNEQGRLKFRSNGARVFDIKALDFMDGQPVMLFMYSTKTELGEIEPGSFETVSLPEDAEDGDHTLRIVGTSQDGVVWALSVPITIFSEAVVTPGSGGSSPAANDGADAGEASSDDTQASEPTPEQSQQPAEQSVNDGPAAQDTPTEVVSSSPQVQTFTAQVFGTALNPMEFDVSPAGSVLAACSEPQEVQRIARVVSEKLLDDGTESEALVERVARANSALAACQASLSFRSADDAASGAVAPVGPQLLFWLLLLLLIPAVRAAVKRVRA
jgi:hypothetical protein